MSSNVRNLTRYVIVTHEGALVEDIDIFLEGSGHVIIYCDGSRYDGDLLALESFAKLHGGVAHPVTPPPDFDQKITVEIPEEDVNIDLGGPVEDWSEDLPSTPSPSGGVNLEEEGSGVQPVKEGPHGPVPLTIPVKNKLLPNVQVTPDMGMYPKPTLEDQGGDGSGFAAIWQGNPAEGPPPDGSVNPYEVLAGHGLSGTYLNVPGLTDHPRSYGSTWCRAPDEPPIPMILCRDLGNIAIGMPRHAGTTIVGSLRPDTGGQDPLIPDHMMWEAYETLSHKDVLAD